MTNNVNGISIDITINSEKLDEVESFKKLGAIVTDQGSKPKYCLELHRQKQH